MSNNENQSAEQRFQIRSRRPPFNFLLADPDRDSLAEISNMLRDGLAETFELKTASFIGEALNILQLLKMDLAILVFEAADAITLDWLRRLRKLRPDMTVILILHSTSELPVGACTAVGVVDVLKRTSLCTRTLADSVMHALLWMREKTISELAASNMHLMEISEHRVVEGKLLNDERPLKQRLPTVHTRLAIMYRNMATEYILHGSRNKPVDKMDEIIAELGVHCCTPRDLINLHVDACTSLLGVGGRLSCTSSETTRLLALDMVSRLATYYRACKLVVHTQDAPG